MAGQNNKNLIIIPKEVIQKKDGLVILSLREYQKLRERAVPVYYLKGKEAKELDNLAEKGLRDHTSGRTRKIKSLRELD